MKKKFIFFIIFISLIGVFFEQYNKSIAKEKTITWNSDTLLTSFEDTPKIYSVEPLIYSYYDGNEWITYKDKEELFRSVNDDITVYDTNPKYISYWEDEENLCLKSVDGEKVALPKNLDNITVSNIEKDKTEIYIQYWLKNRVNPEDRKRLGTIININGEEILPKDYYGFFQGMYVDNDFIFTIDRLTDKTGSTVLFYNNKQLLSAQTIGIGALTEKDNNNVVLRQEKARYLYNIKTGWKSKEFAQIKIFMNNILLVNNIHNGNSVGDLDIFKLNNEELIKINPTEKPIDFAVFFIGGYKTNSNSSFFIREKGSEKVLLYTLLQNGTWEEPIVTNFELPSNSRANLHGYWSPEKKGFLIFGTSDIPGRDFIHLFYDSQENLLLDRRIFDNSNRDSSVLYKVESNTNDELAIEDYFPAKLLVTDRYKNKIFTQNNITDTFSYPRMDTKKVFYKYKDKWFYFDLEKKRKVSLKDITELRYNEDLDVAYYKKASGEQGLFALETDETYTLPKKLPIETFLYGDLKTRVAIFVTKESNNKVLEKLTW